MPGHCEPVILARTHLNSVPSFNSEQGTELQMSKEVNWKEVIVEQRDEEQKNLLNTFFFKKEELRNKYRKGVQTEREHYELISELYKEYAVRLGNSLLEAEDALRVQI